MMASPAKPATDLLWAYQMKREHRYLQERLHTLESTFTKQDKRIAAAENNDGSTQDARITEISNQVRTLQESDVTEQIAGLAGELRDTRQQVERMRDKLRGAEKKSKEDSSVASDKDIAVQERLSEIELHLGRVQVDLQRLEKGFELTALENMRVNAEKFEEANKQHSARFENLEEQLHQLTHSQVELRSLLAEHNQRSQNSKLHPQFIISTQVASRHTRKSDQNPTLPPVPSFDQTKRKNHMEKEIDQLLCGDGSLTNAPLLFERVLHASPSANNKRKFSGRKTRSQAKRLKETQPIKDKIERGKIPTGNRAAEATTNAAIRSQKSPATRSTRVTKRQKPHETIISPFPNAPLPSSSSGSRNTQVAPRPTSHRPPTPKTPTLRGRDKHNVNGKVVNTKALSPQREPPKQNARDDQRPPQRRRRIEQDDNMEEFLAKCREAIGS